MTATLVRGAPLTGRPAAHVDALILGAGPAGLTAASVLAHAGLRTLVLERRSRTGALSRARAGLLQHGVVQLLRRYGLAAGVDREARPVGTAEFRIAGEQRLLPYGELTGRPHSVYRQQALVRDLVTAYEGLGGTIRWGIEDVEITGLDRGRTADDVRVTWRDAYGDAAVHCDWVVGADGHRGLSRSRHLPGRRDVVTRDYGVTWLALLAETPPSANHTLYGLHADGFAGHMLRSPDVTRFYVQVPRSDDPYRWSDEWVWDQLRTRLHTDGWELSTGPIIERSMLHLRGESIGPPRVDRLLLAGDAAHLVPPLGAQGANLAIRDAVDLGTAIVAAAGGDPLPLAAYPSVVTRRAGAAEAWSARLSELLHVPPAVAAGLERSDESRRRADQLVDVFTSSTAIQAFAEHYAGVSDAPDVPSPL